MHEHADDPDEFNRNMIALGDINIDRTVAGTGSTRKYYDQIAWFNKGKRSA